MGMGRSGMRRSGGIYDLPATIVGFFFYTIPMLFIKFMIVFGFKILKFFLWDLWIILIKGILGLLFRR